MKDLKNKNKTRNDGRDEHGRLLPGHTGNPNGRPKGKSFRDYFNDKEIAEVVEFAKKNYKRDSKIFQYVIEHIFGKPTQPISGTGDNGELLFGLEKQTRDILNSLKNDR